ncbi:MAG: response regulator [Anaerolineae bacterium]
MSLRARIVVAWAISSSAILVALFVLVPSMHGAPMVAATLGLAAAGVLQLFVMDRLVLSSFAHLADAAGLADDATAPTAQSDESGGGRAATPDTSRAAGAVGAPSDTVVAAMPEAPTPPLEMAAGVESDAQSLPVTSPMPRSTAADLEHAKRLESIGLLAGGIAHDFNNLLTGILGQVSLALSLLPPDSPARPPINKAAGAAERAADMTRQLLAYAGKGQFQLTKVALNELIIENIGMLESMLPGRALLKLELEPGLPRIEADRGQVQQVLMNLVLNAAESIEGRTGSVTVATGVQAEPLSPEKYVIGGESLGAGTHVYLSVTDTGTGMDAQTLEQVFDPFFSTKGSGRGLGLSAALGIVRAHEGAIDINSEVGSGTSFRVLFPVVRDEPQSTELQSEAALPDLSVASSALVLVIDDEAAVREATSDMLTAAGLSVLTAHSGPAGIERLAEHGRDVGVVLLDMQMPGMNGELTFDGLQEVAPSVPVILMSGYSESEATQRFMGRGLRAFLQKPFNYDTLLRVVGDALAAGPRRV